MEKWETVLVESERRFAWLRKNSVHWFYANERNTTISQPAHPTQHNTTSSLRAGEMAGGGRGGGRLERRTCNGRRGTGGGGVRCFGEW